MSLGQPGAVFADCESALLGKKSRRCERVEFARRVRDVPSVLERRGGNEYRSDERCLLP